MAILSTTNASPFDNDPLLPWLLSIKEKLDTFTADPTKPNSAFLEKLVSDCITTFQNDPKYRNDVRFLKVWFLYMDCTGNFDGVFREMEERKICFGKSMLYETCALFLEAKGKLTDAHRVYRMGISRNAEPIERLKKAHSLFLERVSDVVKACSKNQINDGVIESDGKSYVNPWSDSTKDDLLRKIRPLIAKYDGYYSSLKNYPGKIPLSTLQNASRNKIVKIGGRDYQIKGRAGQGGFAEVFKAYVNSEPDEVVALKIQKPPFPWEFHMYRQLDKRVPENERSKFGVAQRMHHYTDYSILVCDFLSHGTLQDVINSYLLVATSMEEVSCVYYTIEMLLMLETLHSADIIHGDFKPDNLLIRNSREYLTGDTVDFLKRSGPWRDQGLCLVDWGRGIDLSLFPTDIEFMGDCGTSGFRCVEMQEDRPWKYQVDTYGLCVVVHMLLHNSYMELQKKPNLNGGYYYLPKSPFKRYWNVELWERFFKRLLNVQPSDDHMTMLRELRESFQEYMSSSPSLINQLKDSLRKQRSSFCSA